MNIVILKGRLTSDIELKTYSKDGKDTTYTNFNLAVPRMGNKGTDFVPCTAWGKPAENIEKFVKKGQEICVHGTWKTGSYQSQSGGRVKTNNCYVTLFEFCGKKGEELDNTDNDFGFNIGDEDDIPFN